MINRKDIQRLLGDENIDVIINNGLSDNLSISSIRINLANYLIRKFYEKGNEDDLSEYPVQGKLVRKVRTAHRDKDKK